MKKGAISSRRRSWRTDTGRLLASPGRGASLRAAADQTPAGIGGETVTIGAVRWLAHPMVDTGRQQRRGNNRPWSGVVRQREIPFRLTGLADSAHSAYPLR